MNLWKILLGRLNSEDFWPSLTKIGGWATAAATALIAKYGGLLESIDPDGVFVTVDTVSTLLFAGIGMAVAGIRNAVEKYLTSQPQ